MESQVRNVSKLAKLSGGSRLGLKKEERRKRGEAGEMLRSASVAHFRGGESEKGTAL
jgi:hypothetical protein